MTGDTNPGEELAQLKFGFPQMVLEPDGAVFLVFWCEEDCIKNIRWLRRRRLTAAGQAWNEYGRSKTSRIWGMNASTGSAS